MFYLWFALRLSLAVGLKVEVDNSKERSPAADNYVEFARQIHREAGAVQQLFASVPPSSSYYMDVGKLPPTLPRLPTLKAWEWRAASTLFDIHSRICAWRLLASWRCRELVTAALHAFDDKQLIVASALVRPLLENAAALCVESILLARTWPLEGASALRNEPAVLQWRADASRLIAQPLGGTRQRKMISELSPERTNILTFIDKAAKNSGNRIFVLFTSVYAMSFIQG